MLFRCFGDQNIKQQSITAPQLHGSQMGLDNFMCVRMAGMEVPTRQTASVVSAGSAKLEADIPASCTDSFFF